ncbi:hypothetical protein JKP88DRAFT_315547 [Tribonema minus]|uniref:Uncharacterized protein n=1 Tax=Tribonema minus TaxID=303371 RepID=A0A835Z2N7_9STRA|nr:hypothetical protein JKP88DRAFT_315547 [Tribonema minus]
MQCSACELALGEGADSQGFSERVQVFFTYHDSEVRVLRPRNWQPEPRDEDGSANCVITSHDGVRVMAYAEVMGRGLMCCYCLQHFFAVKADDVDASFWRTLRNEVNTILLYYDIYAPPSDAEECSRRSAARSSTAFTSRARSDEPPIEPRLITSHDIAPSPERRPGPVFASTTSNAGTAGTLVQSNVSYSMVAVPDKNSPWVTEAKEDVLQNVHLNTLMNDLDRAGDMMFLAYCGVQGTRLSSNVANRQFDLAELCQESSLTMVKLRDGSNTVVQILIGAYRHLLEGQEDAAITKVKRCAGIAERMATSCDELASEYKNLRDLTRGDSTAARQAVTDQVELQKELGKARVEMEAQSESKKAMREDIEKQLKDVAEDIERETKRADVAAGRAHAAIIMGAIAGAIGAGLGGAMAGLGNAMAGNGGAAVGGPAMLFRRNRNPPDSQATDPMPSDSAGIQPSELPETQQHAAAARKLEELQDAKDQAEVHAHVAAQKVDSCRTVLLAAQAAGDASAVQTATANLATAQREQEIARVKHEQAVSKLDGAQQALTAAAEALRHAMSAVREDVANMSNRAADEAAAANTQRRKLLSCKREVELKNNAALGEIAGLTARLSAHVEEKAVAQSTQAALEMACWAFDNIHVALLDATTFWRGMQRCCESLAKPAVLERAGDIQLFNSDRQARIEAYTRPEFVHIAVSHLVQWTALASVCDDYRAAADAVGAGVKKNIRKSPSVSEARNMIEGLKQCLLDRLTAEQSKSNENLQSIAADLDLTGLDDDTV